VRVVQHAVVEAEPQFEDRGIATQVLVGQEQHPLSTVEGPGQRPFRVRRRADGTAIAANESLNRRCRVHVRHRYGLLRRTDLREHVPGGLDLCDRRHVGHRAASGEVGQDHLLLGRGQNVGALGHEMHTTEHDVLGLRPGGRVASELERVARDIGELDHFVALVVVSEDEHALAELLLRRLGACNEGRIAGHRQIAGALNPTLGAGVAPPAQQEQRRRGSGRFNEGRHASIVAQSAHATGRVLRVGRCDLRD
jgi:hypothetical protein